MKKSIWVIIISYVMVLTTLLVLTFTLKWSMWAVGLTAGIPVIGFLIYLLVSNTKKKEKEDDDEKKKEIGLDIATKFLEDWVMSNDHVIDLSQGNIEVGLYVPKQEGENKLSVWIGKYPRYWNSDLLMVAMSRHEKEVLLYRVYDSDDSTYRHKFEQEVDKAVINPVMTIETEEPVIDATGRTTIVKKRTPVQYLKLQETERKAKQEQEEEGVEEE